MTTTTLLAGVDRKGGAYRVRVRFGGRAGSTHTEHHHSLDVANRRALELRALRAAGLTPATAPAELSLADYAQALYARKRTVVSRKTRRRLRPRTLEWWQRILQPWQEGPLGLLPPSLLPYDRVEQHVHTRAADKAKTAADELWGLKATLRFAGERGAQFDPRLLALEPPTTLARTRRVLTVAELELLAACAPDYAQRLILFLGTTGLRVGEAFTLTDERVYLDEQAIFVPAELCKEAVDKWVDLTAEETLLLREQLAPLRAVGSPTSQLPCRAAGTKLVFPTKTGRGWRHYQFLRLVWYKARERAAVRAGAAAPFPDLQPHDLRATAATLMRDAGIPREEAAGRLGHADSGQLLDRLYDQGDRRARTKAALHACAPDGLRARVTEPAAVGLEARQR